MRAAAARDAAPVYELAQGDLAVIEARALSVELPLSGLLAPLARATVKSKVSGVVGPRGAGGRAAGGTSARGQERGGGISATRRPA